MSDQRLEKARSLQQAIHEVLIKDWDPIGVKDIVEAQDEYDSYIPTIYKMLISRAPKYEIFEYLWWLETEHMGLNGNRQYTEECVQKLVSLVGY